MVDQLSGCGFGDGGFGHVAVFRFGLVVGQISRGYGDGNGNSGYGCCAGGSGRGTGDGEGFGVSVEGGVGGFGVGYEPDLLLEEDIRV